MRNRILLILFISLIVSVPSCLADEQFYNKVMEKVQKEQNDYYENLSNCVSGKYPILFTIDGSQNGICKFQSASPIFTESGVKYQVVTCNMPKNIFKPYINDIKDLTAEQYKSKWETTYDKYCKTEYQDNYQY